MPHQTHMKAPQTYREAPAQATTTASAFQLRGWSEPAELQRTQPVLDPKLPRPHSASAGFNFGQVSVFRPASAGPDHAPGLRLSSHKIPVASWSTPKLALNRTGLPHGGQPGLVVQPKLTIGAPNDKYEREADRVAAQVVQQLHAPASPALQPQATPEAEKLQMKPLLQLTGSEGSIAAPPTVENSIQQLRGRGQPLAAPIRQPMERAFDADFSGVRVHTDAQADQLNQSIQAKAFTTGQNVFFRRGFYSPHTQSGQTLIAHELTHVVQQLDSGLASGLSQSASAEGLIQRTTHHYNYNDDLYTTKEFSGSRQRPTSVVANNVSKHKVGSRGRTPKAMSLLHDPSDSTKGSDPALGYDGGHILGLSLGGADASFNIVPMYPGFNRGTWKTVENEILSDSKSTKYRGFGVTVQIEYAADTSTVPQSLEAQSWADYTTMVGRKKTTTRKKVTDYGKKTQPTDIEVTPRLDDTKEETIKGSSDSDRSTVITKAAAYIALTDVADADFLLKNKHLQTSTKTDYPDQPKERPYEYLDILTFAGVINLGVTFSTARLFSSLQRELILQANMAKNGGSLKSDDPKDSYQDLSEQGSANFPEIDHIIPKAFGGSNYFSNARVVSWHMNNKDDRTKDIRGLVDVARLKLTMPATGTKVAKAAAVVPSLVARLVLNKNPVPITDVYDEMSTEYNLNISSLWKDAIKLALDNEVKNGNFTEMDGKYSVA